MSRHGKRRSGILLPVFSLPSRGGIGCFSAAAYTFLEQLAQAGQRCWQILPLAPVGGWYSPYQPSSCFAGEPLFIDPYELRRQELLSDDDLARYESSLGGGNPTRVHYARLIPMRTRLLRRAYSRFRPGSEFEQFCTENASWLDDYALYSALRDAHGGRAWPTWEAPYRYRRPQALKKFAAAAADDIRYTCWTQYEFFRQWRRLKQYANSLGIAIIGDVPIYAAYESADCWAHPDLFKLDRRLRPLATAGCPPDAFSVNGQMWGNPLYRWARHRQTGYRWWIERIQRNFRLYDVLRLDHFRGLIAYYSIPVGSRTAADGCWVRGPGFALLNALRDALGPREFIAEDLGTITPAVRRAIRRAGFPGMKVLQFAFDGSPDNPYLLKNIEPNSVVYTGTHDNDTTCGWYRSQSTSEQQLITSYIRSQSGGTAAGRKAPRFDPFSATRALTELAMRSRADTCILPLQDLLVKGSEARINTPATTGRNWSWRLAADEFSEIYVEYLNTLTKESDRL
ncbi:MAG: 4-alpha-glucanotransferase [Anaerovoracaceae bacterium]|jgi:4-alpha-glucanotransferase